MKHKIAVIGAGKVGSALGENWRSKGHSVVYGVTDPGDAKHSRLGRGNVMAPSDAARGVDIIVLATPWPATEAACRSLGTLTGKTVIDCTNPLANGPERLSLATDHSLSGGEQVQRWCPEAAVVKTLNQTGFETMADPGKLSIRPVMFAAGDAADNKRTVLGLVDDLGFEAVDAGPLSNARLLEAYAMLWIDLAFKRGQGRSIAFALARPKPQST